MNLYLYNGLRVIFLPAYTPELAPIEKYFSIIKSQMLKEISGIQFNWKSDNSMEEMSRVSIKKNNKGRYDLSLNNINEEDEQLIREYYLIN